MLSQYYLVELLIECATRLVEPVDALFKIIFYRFILAFELAFSDQSQLRRKYNDYGGVNVYVR